MQITAQKNFFSHSFLFGIFLLVASLPYSKFMMSIAEIILFLSWIFEGGLKEKLMLFKQNRTALILSSLFILHILGLLYTSDLKYGMEDIQKKIPLMLLPLLFSTTPPLSKQMLERVMALFVLSVFVATIISLFVLLGFTHRNILQPQQASIYISHIRFGLLISLSFFILGYFVITTQSLIIRVVLPIIMAWFVTFLIMMESETGLICTIVVSTALLGRFILKMKNSIVKISLLALFVLGCGAVLKVFYFTVENFEHVAAINAKQLPVLTKNGNPYLHDTLNKETENGNYIWINVCEAELAQEWKKRSSIDFNGKDLRGNELKFTLIRFLTSKGLTKDAQGVDTLSEQEIKAVEKGIPNVNFMGLFNPAARIQKIMWEFDTYLKGGNPSGHSVVQRLEFWKAALGIIHENLLFGVGTGDVKNAFELQYEKMNSPLTKEWRLRSHNQFLAIGTAFGLVGIIWFLVTLLYPVVAEKKHTDYLYLTFFIIAFLSMFTEDTLETQLGVTFFAFFNSFFLFLKKENG